MVILILILFIGFLCRSVLSFGFSAVIFPLLIIANFQNPHILTIIFETVISLFFGVKYFNLKIFKTLFSLIFYSIFGVFVGFILVKRINNNELTFVIPILITIVLTLLIMNNSLLSKLKIFKSKYFLGSLSGLMTVWSGISGPPIVLYTLSKEKDYLDFKSLLSMYFLILYITVSTIIGFEQFNNISQNDYNVVLLGVFAVLIFCYFYNKIDKAIDSYLSKKNKLLRQSAFWFLLLICSISIFKIL